MVEEGTTQIQNKNQPNERSLQLTFVFWFFGAVLLAGLDQLAKWLAERQLLGSIPVYKNFNFAFSLPLPQAVMYLVYTAVLAAAALYLLKNFQQLGRAHRLAWCLIAAGALSNVGERAVTGYVRDFIYLANGIINPADIYIVVGMVLLLTLRK